MFGHRHRCHGCNGGCNGCHAVSDCCGAPAPSCHGCHGGEAAPAPAEGEAAPPPPAPTTMNRVPYSFRKVSFRR
jgi:hypothetical protein